MGSNDIDAQKGEKPLHRVYLDGYWVYQKLVTVAQYKQYSNEDALDMPKPPPWKWQDFYPMVLITWQEANDYAKWAGVSLPTKAQWEKAARGMDGNRYPWGFKYLDIDDVNKYNSRLFGATEVGRHPEGASPYGCLDMVGNVGQWCKDWYKENYYAKSPDHNPAGPDSSDWNTRVVRGGGWARLPGACRCAWRGVWNPKIRNDDVGFRCVISPPGQ